MDRALEPVTQWRGGEEMELLLLLAVLVCPLVMAGMMVWMMLQMRGPKPGGDRACKEEQS